MILTGVVRRKNDLQGYDDYPTGILDDRGFKWLIRNSSCDMLLSGLRQYDDSKKGWSQSNDNCKHTVVLGHVFNDEAIAKKYFEDLEKNSAWIISRIIQAKGWDGIRDVSGNICIVRWDVEKQQLDLCTDRTGGFWTLYYVQNLNEFAFSTSLPDLLKIPWVSRVLDPLAVSEYLSTGYVLPPRTFIHGIKKLWPGELLSWRDGDINIKSIDGYERGSKDPVKDNIPQRFSNLLEQSLADRAAANTSNAYLLSGGIDSSILVKIALSHSQKKSTIYSASFPGSQLDESAYAKLVVQSLDKDVRHIIFDMSGHNVFDSLPTIIAGMPEPMSDYSILPSYQLLNLVSQQSETIISGDGPDHLLGRHNPLAAKRFVPPVLRYLLPHVLGSFGLKIKRAASGTLLDAYRELFLLPNWGMDHEVHLTKMISCWRIPSILKESNDTIQKILQLEGQSLDSLIRGLSIMDLYIDGAFGVFQKIALAARLNGITVITPYLDRALVDFMLGLDRQWKVDGTWLHMLASRGRSKYILKNCLAPALLPQDVIRKRKGGFTPPLSNWLCDLFQKTGEGNWIDNGLCKDAGIHAAYVKELVAQHSSGVRDWTMVLFMIIVLNVWYKINISRSLNRSEIGSLVDCLRQQ